MATVQQGLGDRSGEAPASSCCLVASGAGRRQGGLRAALDPPGARPVRRAHLLLHRLHRADLDMELGRHQPEPAACRLRELHPAVPRPAVLGRSAPHGGVLRRHLHGPDLPRPHLRCAPALADPAGSRLQGDHFHPGRARTGDHGAGLPGDAGARGSVQRAAAATSGSARWRSRGSGRRRRRCRR